MNFAEARDALADADSRFVAVDGQTIHYKRSGAGPPLVLMHGSGSSLHTYDRVAEQLASRADVIRMDLPGFGLTGPRPDRDYRVSAFVETVDAFLRELGVVRAVVAGNSLGGNIAWNLALRKPELVQGLVLINSTGYPGKSLPLAMKLARNPFGRVLLRRFANRSGVERNLRGTVGPQFRDVVTPEFVDRVYSYMSLPGNQEAFIDLARTDQVDTTDGLPLISAPTAVLRSAGMDGQHFASVIPNSWERTHPSAGHLLPDEDPDWLSAAIELFLDSRVIDTKDN